VSGEATRRAQALLDIGRADEAAAVLSKALAADPAAWRPWCALGVAHLNGGRYREAADCARRASELNPGAEWPHRVASIAKGRLGQRAGALAAARESVRLEPDGAYPQIQLAVALSCMSWRHRREAYDAVARALALAPDDADIQFMAGNVAMRYRRHRLAAARYERALEIDASHSGALNNLALVRLRNGRTIAAANGFGSAAALNPTTDMHRRNLETAVRRTLAYAAVVLGAVGFVEGADPAFGWVAVALAAAGGVLYVLRARRRLDPAAWSYVKRVPFTKPAAIHNMLLLTVQAALIGIAFATGASSLALLPFLFAGNIFVRLCLQRILG
jgi:tetratricopeptide (TPR) repeat protein